MFKLPPYWYLTCQKIHLPNKSLLGVGGVDEKHLHTLGHLSTWFSVGSPVWGEEHRLARGRGAGFEVKSLMPFPPPFLCSVLAVQCVSSPLPALTTCSSRLQSCFQTMIDLSPLELQAQTNTSSYKLPWSCCSILATEKWWRRLPWPEYDASTRANI